MDLDYPLWPVFGALGLVAGAVAAAMAYIIFDEEYSHHFTDRRRTRFFSLQAAAFSFLFFLLLSLAAGYVLTVLLE